MGKIARHLQQWTEAERLLTNSLELLHQVEARYEMARTLCEKVKLMWAMRRHEEATRIKEEAQILFDEFNLSIETCNDADQRTAS